MGRMKVKKDPHNDKNWSVTLSHAQPLTTSITTSRFITLVSTCETIYSFFSPWVSHYEICTCFQKINPKVRACYKVVDQWHTLDKPPYLLKINEHPTNVMIRNMRITQQHKMKIYYLDNTIPTLVICVKKNGKNSKSFMFSDGATFHHLEVMKMDAF